MLTQTARYALRALIHLAQVETRGYCQTREIAEKIDVPANYLGKTLQKLAHARVLDSQKGLHGGFRLAKPIDRISLYQILVAIEAVPRDTVEEPDLHSDLPSSVYAKFSELSSLYNDFLRKTSLADMIGQGGEATAEQVQSEEPAKV
jgi:Rrf2 family protein